MSSRDLHFMQRAIALARKGMDDGHGGPFGAIVVKGKEIIGEGFNSVTSTNDPTAHAEVMAIRDACTNLNDFQLTGCTIYTTCEPCPMCLGAIYWARPDRLVFGCTRKDAADVNFDDEFIYKELTLDHPERSIPTDHVGREDALKLFEDWGEMDDKILY